VDFVKVTDGYQKTHHINAQYVRSVVAENAGTKITFFDGESLSVMETPEQILQMLQMV
jgi:hypothetical protein